MEAVDYKSAIRAARRSVWQAWKAYRFEIKKQRLIREHADLVAELKEMGVVIKQVPVVLMPSHSHRVKVSHIESVAIPAGKKRRAKK